MRLSGIYGWNQLLKNNCNFQTAGKTQSHTDKQTLLCNYEEAARFSRRGDYELEKGTEVGKSAATTTTLVH